MIEYLEDIEVLPVKKAWEKKAPLTSEIKLPAIDKSKKEDNRINKADEIITHFNKWVMPPQPQAYIKCPRYDFF